MVSAPSAGATATRPPGRSSPLEAPAADRASDRRPDDLIGSSAGRPGARVEFTLLSCQVAGAKPTLTTQPILLTFC